MSADLEQELMPTPARVRLLGLAKRGDLWWTVATGQSWDVGGNKVTAAVTAMEKAGWLRIAPAGPDEVETRSWALTDLGEQIWDTYRDGER